VLARAGAAKPLALFEGGAASPAAELYRIQRDLRDRLAQLLTPAQIETLRTVAPDPMNLNPLEDL
jgi:hypothetical protein